MLFYENDKIKINYCRCSKGMVPVLPSTFLTFFSIQIILYSPFIFPQYSSHSSLSRLYCTVPLIFSSTFITFFSIWIILYSPFIFPSIICPILFTSHPSDPPLKVACSEPVQHELLLYHEFSRTVQSGLKFYATNVTWRDQSDPLIPHPYIPLHSLYVLYTLHGCLSFCLFESNKRQIEI